MHIVLFLHTIFHNIVFLHIIRCFDILSNRRNVLDKKNKTKRLESYLLGLFDWTTLDEMMIDIFLNSKMGQILIFCGFS